MYIGRYIAMGVVGEFCVMNLIFNEFVESKEHSKLDGLLTLKFCLGKMLSSLPHFQDSPTI